MAIAVTTALQAVNTMLQTIGESAVTDLSDPAYEVSAAVTILDEVVREVCMDSYVFNTEEDRVLTADGSTGKISATTPEPYVQIRNQGTGEDYVIRSGFVYSMKNKTDVFAASSTITITGVYLLEFLELPEAAKRYCVIRAARTYADRMVGSRDIRAFSERDELDAKAKLNDYEFGIDRINMLRDSSSVANSLVRSTGGSGNGLY
tara:strand:- start:3568 stop:4182 length:615 start_codon:yes stop_codon:yes gene_type:complete